MSADAAVSTSGESSYIRASAGGPVDGRRVIRLLAALCVLILVSVVVATTIEAANQNHVQTRLQREGVPVRVTVTGCEGVSSGIGQALVYYVCRGTYVLDGHSHNEVIGGTRAVYKAGRTLKAVTVPGDPALLSTATAVAKRFSPWTPFITPIALAAATVALVLGLLVWSRRRRRVPLSRP